MSNTKKNTKVNEDTYNALQGLIAQGRKDGMIRAADLNAQLEKMDLSPEKIEEIYDRFEAMNIQVITGELDLDLGDDMDLVDMDGDMDLLPLEEEDLVVVFFKCTMGNGMVNKVFDMYRVTDGKLAEHWDSVEHDVNVAAITAVNGNGPF